MDKVQLPETRFFYELAMRRSAEIKGVVSHPKKARPPVSDVCPKCNAPEHNTRLYAFACETMYYNGCLDQSSECRIIQLSAECDTKQKEIAELTAENERLRAVTKEALAWIERHQASGSQSLSEWDDGYQQALGHLEGILASPTHTR